MDLERARLQRQAKSARRLARAEEPVSEAGGLLALQGAAGNAAVTRLLGEGGADADLADSAGAAPGPEPATLEAGTRDAIAADVETIMALASRPTVDEDAQAEIASLLQRWHAADAAAGGATLHLDELLRRLKGRQLHRRSVRAMESTTAATAYDALWLVLEGDALGAFAGVAGASAEGSAGPLTGERSAFWAGLGQTRAMGLYAAFEALAPGADRHEDDTVKRLSTALAGIDADPEWMRLVEEGGHHRGSHIFGASYSQAERLLLHTEASRVSHAGARYLWRMVDSADEELPWLAEPIEPSDAAREVRLAGREIARRIDFQRRITRLSGPGMQRDPKVLAEIVRLTGWITRLAARAHGMDDGGSRDGLRRLARDVARQLELAGANVRPGTYERELVTALERPERDLPERQEEVAGVLLDLVADAAHQLVESGHPGGGSADEPSAAPPPTE